MKYLLTLILSILTLSLYSQCFIVKSIARDNVSIEDNLQLYYNNPSRVVVNNDSIITILNKEKTLYLKVINYWEENNTVYYDVITEYNQPYSVQLIKYKSFYQLLIDNNIITLCQNKN